ncbi:energy transducer TonB [Alteromonas sp. BL110]|uniref:energy transducer TonB n=1 Tax=Alteromonas sp. BL110 TaxID=1714845 RepID=UPI000E4FF5C7|nr:energy transducer TonB [Alteromonas sp. BL110]AXT40439.1 energy transducer TonB [Alteromonas sp. BL110]RKM79672.1 TonB family protein [Alteromonas sp. BL110]
MQTTILPSANSQHLVQRSVLPFAKAPSYKRAINLATIALAGGAVTAGLFVLMAELIRQDKVNISEAPPVFFEPVIYQPEEERIITKKPIAPIEQVIKTPPQQIVDIDPEPNEGPGSFEINTQVPNTALNLSINLNNAQGDMQATPQFRVDPTYPPQASRDGIEGWVKLGFTVSASGAVSDIKVLDSEPKRVFDRAARRALKRWKYKPKLDGGKPVSQLGMVVVLDFKLEQ